MSGRTILNVESPKTQTFEAVKSLLAWRGRAAEPLPSFVEMGTGDNRMVLILSNRKDCFYVTTARDCSCPAHNWHPGQRCKHQRKHFAEQIAKPTASESGGILHAGKWTGGMNGPVSPLPGENIEGVA